MSGLPGKMGRVWCSDQGWGGQEGASEQPQPAAFHLGAGRVARPGAACSAVQSANSHEAQGMDA